MKKVILLLMVLLFSPFNLLAYENKYFLEIESILLVMRKEKKDNKLNKKDYASDPIDSCKCVVSVKEKNNITSFMADICKKEVDILKVSYF